MINLIQQTELLWMGILRWVEWNNFFLGRSSPRGNTIKVREWLNQTRDEEDLNPLQGFFLINNILMMIDDIYNIVNDYAICWEPQMVVVYINFDNIFLVAFGHQKKSWIKFFLVCWEWKKEATKMEIRQH